MTTPIMMLFEKAKNYCEQNNIKLTPLRTDVLSIFCQATRPLTAYDALYELRKKRAKAEAMTIYRVLEFFLKHAVLHRIESTNSYFCCTQKNHHHSGAVLICKKCEKVLEADSEELQKLINLACKKHHFHVSEQLIELFGVCEDCI